MMIHCLQRWSNIAPGVGERLVFAGGGGGRPIYDLNARFDNQIAFIQ